jgi:hypothetical protein
VANKKGRRAGSLSNFAPPSWISWRDHDGQIREALLLEIQKDSYEQPRQSKAPVVEFFVAVYGCECQTEGCNETVLFRLRGGRQPNAGDVESLCSQCRAAAYTAKVQQRRAKRLGLSL